MFYIEGPLHKIKVKFVTAKSLKRIAQAPKEQINGLYSSDQNTIWVNKDVSEEEKIHLLLHELGHALEEHVRYVEDEESRVHIIATFLRKLTKTSSIETLLSKDNI